jgi:anti-sigma regulatory factor (Ser/Thr protein kinase)
VSQSRSDDDLRQPNDSNGHGGWPASDSPLPAASGNGGWAREGVPRAPGPTLAWPATPVSVRAARKAVVRAAREAGATEAQLIDIRLAVGEALNNAILHAYAAPGVRGATFRVSTERQDGHFSVWVGDDGLGVAGVSDGLGLGLGLMAVASESLRVGVLDDGHTQVELRFAL